MIEIRCDRCNKVISSERRGRYINNNKDDRWYITFVYESQINIGSVTNYSVCEECYNQIKELIEDD